MTPADRECLACGALPGKPCLQPNGKISRAVHAARVRGTERSRPERHRNTAHQAKQ